MKRYLFILLCCLPLIGKGQIITTVAGNGNGGFSGDGGLATNAKIGAPAKGVFDKNGNFYFTIRTSHRIRKVSPSGIISSIAGNGSAGYIGDGSMAVNAVINNPVGICVDDSNNIYFADLGNDVIRRIDAISGIITTFAGNGVGAYSGDGGLAINASLNTPTEICFDHIGNMYIADASNHCVRKIDTFHIITTIAGTGQNGYNGDAQLAVNAQLSDPEAVTCDSIGNVFISDFGNKRVRKVDIVTDSIKTIVGTGLGNYNGDNIPASTAEVSSLAIIFNSIGELFIADLNQRIRKVDNLGIIHTIAGVGTAGYSGDDSLATLAKLYNPEGLAVDSCGNVYFCDVQNRRVRKITYTSCYTSGIRSISPLTFTLSPNPATSQLTITSNTKLKHITVTNALGIVVRPPSSLELSGLWRMKENESDKLTIDMHDWSPGIYFVRIEDVNGTVRTEKIIKE